MKKIYVLTKTEYFHGKVCGFPGYYYRTRIQNIFTDNHHMSLEDMITIQDYEDYVNSPEIDRENDFQEGYLDYDLLKDNSIEYTKCLVSKLNDNYEVAQEIGKQRPYSIINSGLYKEAREHRLNRDRELAKIRAQKLEEERILKERKIQLEKCNTLIKDCFTCANNAIYSVFVDSLCPLFDMEEHKKRFDFLFKLDEFQLERLKLNIQCGLVTMDEKIEYSYFSLNIVECSKLWLKKIKSELDTIASNLGLKHSSSSHIDDRIIQLDNYISSRSTLQTELGKHLLKTTTNELFRTISLYPLDWAILFGSFSLYSEFKSLGATKCEYENMSITL